MNRDSINPAASLGFRRLAKFISAGLLLVILPLVGQSAHAQVMQIISFTNSAPIIINNNYVPATPYPATMGVSLPSTNVSKVTASIFGLTDPSIGGSGSGGGLDILLAGPATTNPAVTVNLMCFAGNGAAVNNANITFDDSGIPFSSSSPVTSGTYQPSDYDNGYNPPQTATNLVSFPGTPLIGTWGLYVIFDDFSGGGVISNGWSLNFYLSVNPPAAVTLAASGVSATSATLNASVSPGSGTASVYFEWGADTNYGNYTVTNVLSTNLDSLQNYALNLGGLAPTTTYHFQVVVVNAAGTSLGGDQSFVTASGSSSGSSPPVLTESLSNGVPVLVLSGTVGSNYVVQYTTNLLKPITWITLTNVTLSSPVVYIYPGAVASKAEFFRALAGSVTAPPPPSLIESLSNDVPVLQLSGTAGYSYTVQYTTSLLAPITWITLTNVTLTSAVEYIYPGAVAGKAEFFRAVEGISAISPQPASLQVSLGSNLALSLTLSGVAGSNYVVQIATSLAGAGNWATLTNLTLASAVQAIAPIPATNGIEFFRAITP